MDPGDLERLLDARIPPVTIAGALVDRLMRSDSLPDTGPDPLARGEQVGEFRWTTPTGRVRRYVRRWAVDTFFLAPSYRR